MREVAGIIAIFVIFMILEIATNPAKTGDWWATFNCHAAGHCPSQIASPGK